MSGKNVLNWGNFVQLENDEEDVTMSENKHETSPKLKASASNIQLLNVLPKNLRGDKLHRMRVACIPCQTSKQKCDVKRPCLRCMAKGKAHLCVDRSSDSVLNPKMLPYTSHAVAEPSEAIVGEVDNKKRKRRSNRRASSLPTEISTEENQDELETISRSVSNLSESSLKSPLAEFSSSSSEDFSGTIDELRTAFQDFSPFAIKDMILLKSHLWSLYLSLASDILGENVVNSMKQELLFMALSVADNDMEASAITTSYNSVKPYPVGKSTAERMDEYSVLYAEQDKELVREAFNLRRLDNSDLGVLRIEFGHINLKGEVEPVIYFNRNLERLLGKKLDHLQLCRGEKVCPFQEVFSAASALQVQQFATDAIFKSEGISSSNMQVEIRRHGTSNAFIPCHVLVLSSYFFPSMSDDEVRSIQSAASAGSSPGYFMAVGLIKPPVMGLSIFLRQITQTYNPFSSDADASSATI